MLGNDTDPDGNSLTAVKASDPTHGALTLNSDGSFTYTPAAGFSGADSFTYKANDGKVDSDAGNGDHLRRRGHRAYVRQLESGAANRGHRREATVEGLAVRRGVVGGLPDQSFRTERGRDLAVEAAGHDVDPGPQPERAQRT